MIRLAIDSFPLRSGMQGSTDYSGLQLYGLEHRSFKNAVITKEVDSRRALFTLGEYQWDDGLALTPEQYKVGFLKMLTSFPTLAGLMRAHLKTMHSHGQQLELKFSRDFPALALEALPNWIPVRENSCVRSGPYRLERRRDGWRLLQKDREVGQVCVVASPQENKRLFEEGLLDFSADTAIHAQDINGSEIKSDTGLIAVLNCSQHLVSNQLKTLKWDLEGLMAPQPLTGFWQRMACSGREPDSVMRGVLTLAYDNFYPNGEYCEMIAGRLRDRGWHINLVLDSYYCPFVASDIKFMIVRALAKHDWFEDQLFNALSRAIPLFRVPSLYWTKFPQRANPMLEVFK